MKNKILLAEDEKELAKAIATILRYSDYDVEIAYNGLEAFEMTKQICFDAIILDVMMPVMDGISSLKKMRESGIDTPILLLTAKSQISDKVEGLDAGANDYLTKPFAKDELLARLRALIRINEDKKTKYTIGNMIFDVQNNELSNDKTFLQLNSKESQIIQILFKNKQRNVPKDEIMTKVLKNGENGEAAIDMYMSFLQDKFKILNANVSITENNGYSLEIKA